MGVLQSESYFSRLGFPQLFFLSEEQLFFRACPRASGMVNELLIQLTDSL